MKRGTRGYGIAPVYVIMTLAERLWGKGRGRNEEIDRAEVREEKGEKERGREKE